MRVECGGEAGKGQDRRAGGQEEAVKHSRQQPGVIMLKAFQQPRLQGGFPLM